MNLTHFCEYNIHFTFSKLASHMHVPSKLFKPDVTVERLGLPASYSGGIWFRSWPGDQLPCSFVIFLSLSREMRG
jgi:hypothetical protein